MFCFIQTSKACNETVTWSRENELNFIPNVPSAKECFEICFSTNNCTAYTWYGSLNKLQDVCILFEAQENQYDCENCLSGLVENGISCYCSQEGECLFDENNYLGDMFANSELDCFLECLNLPGNFHTDLGSLSGNFDFGYFTVWKFSNFSATMILCEIDFG